MEHLGEVAAEWDGVMPPCFQSEDGASYSKEGVSDSEEFGEFEILIFPPYYPPSNGTAGMFRSSQSYAPESTAGSRTNSALFSYSHTLSTERTEASYEISQETVKKANLNQHHDPLGSLSTQAEQE